MESENTFKKTIKIFMMDGDPNKRLSCEVYNWAGKVYKIPRTEIKNSSDIKDIKNTGVYLLFGRNPKDPKKEMVYVGEADNVYSRLNQHLRDSEKDFWNNAVIGISKDNNLNKAHARLLENKLYNLASRKGRFEIDNNNVPSEPSISKPEEEYVEEFLYNFKILVNALGYKVFEEVRKPEKDEEEDENYFVLSGPRGANARGQTDPEGFVVLEGSKIASETVESVPKWVVGIRENLKEEGIITEMDDDLELTKDYVFSSPSAAAAVVLGRSANGLIEWELRDGTTLKEYESPED